jgi:peptidyl-prolyl cis-trans isomerase B (cyclophilin B)
VSKVENSATVQVASPIAPAAATAEIAQTNALAVVSLVLSLMFFGIVASIFGHIALSQIKKTGEHGRGLAIAGMVIGYLTSGLLIAAIALLVVLAQYWQNFAGL